MLKNILWLAISVFIIYFITDFILQGIYNLLIRSDTHLTFHLPLIHLTKYFIIAVVVIVFLYRHLSLAPTGKKLLPIFLIVSIAGILISSLWFNAVTQEKITKFRVIWPTVYTWDEVDHVETKVYREDRMTRPRGVNPYESLKVYTKYDIHLKDGSVMNVWENLDNVYELHQTVLAKNIDVTYNPMELESFEQKYTSYFKDDMAKAEFIFYGIDDGK